MQDCRAYFAATGRRVTFEYTLMAGVNASPQDVSCGTASLHVVYRAHWILLVVILTRMH